MVKASAEARFMKKKTSIHQMSLFMVSDHEVTDVDVNRQRYEENWIKG